MTDDTTTNEHPDEQESEVPISRGKLWLFRVIALLIPFLLLVLLELVLRLVGYGYPSQYFLHTKGEDVYHVNSEFGLRFFSPEMNRRAGPAYFDVKKQEGSYRVFVLGGSAAQGVPDPGYSFSEILRTMLRETYPDAKFEVVQTAMTAINSHVVLPIARDAATHEPDLFIVYMGNNEVVGPFGAGTVFDGYTQDLSSIRRKIAMRKWKIIQLTSAIGHNLRTRNSKPEWESMAMFKDNRIRANDPRMAGVYDHYKHNLEDICLAASKHGADTILCTVGTNLADCSPFASAHGEDVPASELPAWEQAFEAGIASAGSGEFEDAMVHFERACQIDPDYAELQFRMGECYESLGRTVEARDAFIKARDLDVLRFRADSRINETVRTVAAEMHDDRVHLVDVEKAMETEGASTQGMIAGEAYFYEHVHMTFEGNYQVAAAIFPEVVKLLPESIRSQNSDPQVPTLDFCAEVMKMDAWQRAQLLQYMLDLTDRQPFVGQFDYEQRRTQMQNEHHRLLKEHESNED